MKKNILLTVLLILATSFCYSQVKVSLQAGAGYNGLTNDELYKNDFGYRFGVGLDIPLSRTWSLQTGLQLLNRMTQLDEFVAKKHYFEGQDYMFYTIMDSKMNAIYLQLPIKAAKYLPFNDICGLQISAGIYIAYGVGGNTKGEMESMYDWHHNSLVPEEFYYRQTHQYFLRETFTKKYGICRWDLGLSLGVDFKYKSCFVGVGVERGLNRLRREIIPGMFKSALSEYKFVTSPRHYGVELHIGYCFSLGK